MFRLVLAVLLACGVVCHGLTAHAADDAQRLRDAYQRLTPQLNDNPFHRPLVLQSHESPSRVEGHIYAVVNHPFATVDGTLNDPVHGPDNWCDVLILHQNIKYCHASGNGNDHVLMVNLGRKVEEPLSSSYRLQFHFRSLERRPDYFKVALNADTGPMSTVDYHITLEAVPIPGERTFLHLTYSYGYGMAGRLAMQAYLATLGANKVGFTANRDPSTGELQYIGGVRGLLERNTMRYYLAIDAYLGALASPPDKRLAQRLTTWFDATEQYRRQLHEVDRQDYLEMKQHEYLRQQTAQ